MSTQQDIYAVGSKNRSHMLNKDNYVPWSSRLLCYSKSRPNGKMIYNSIINGPYVRRMIPEPEADDQAIQTILFSLPEDIYAAVDSCETAQKICSREEGVAPSFHFPSHYYSFLGIANQNPNRNGNVVAARTKGNTNRNHGIQLQAKEFDLMVAIVDLDEIEEVNANCILMRPEKIKDGLGYNAVPPPAADLYLSPKKDLPTPTVESTSEEGQNKNSSTSEGVASPNTPKPFVKFVKPKDCQSESKPNKKETPKKPPVKYAEMYRRPSQKTTVRGNQRNWNNLKTQQLGPDFAMKKKACYNYGNFSHLANDCRKRVQRETTRSQNHAYVSASHRSVGHRSYGAHMRPSHRPAGHRPHGPLMRPMKSNMNVINRRNRVKDVQASAYWVGKPVKPNSASIILKRYDYVDNKLHDTNYENAKIRAQLFDKVFEKKDTTHGMSMNTKFSKQSILGKQPSSSITELYTMTPLPKSKGLLKIDETHALSKQVTSNSPPTPQESKVVKNDNVIAPIMFMMNPFKTSREENTMPNKPIKACVKITPITISQPHVLTKKVFNSNSNNLSSKGVDNTAKTKRPHPRSNIKNDRVPSVSKIIIEYLVKIIKKARIMELKRRYLKIVLTHKTPYPSRKMHTAVDNDLFTYEVKVANVPCDLNGIEDLKLQMSHEANADMWYDPSDVEFTKWINTNVFGFKTPMCKAFKEFNYLLQIDPDLLTKYSEWPTFSWREDGYCNGKNLPGAYIVGNTIYYQDLEWYDALKDNKLKNEALKNKAIMEGIIDDIDESSNNGWRRWDGYEIADHDKKEREYKNKHEDEERCELFDDHELPVCIVRRFKMIKYSFEQNKEYVVVKE
nr:ribonuclease H-like domain-containing protein [Tanacetum cinerariifolium]